MSLNPERVTSDTGLRYRVRRGTPHGPLILLLHGLSGDENVMWLFDHALPRSATVVSPCALFAQAAGFSWARSVSRGEAGPIDFTEALEALQRFIPEMIQRYEVDEKRVIVMGFSQGAALSYALALTQPDLLYGVIALAGFMPNYPTAPQPVSARLRSDSPAKTRAASNVPAAQPCFLIIHSTADDIVPIALARAARSVLEARGALLEYHEYPGGHKISAQGLKDITRWIERIFS